MTTDQEPGDTVLDPADRARLARLADEAAVAAGPVPAPRPEVLARVLDGLRDLPAVTRDARRGEDDGGGGPALPLPRRR